MAEEESRLEEERKRREEEERKKRDDDAKNRAAELERLELEYSNAKAHIQAKAQRIVDELRQRKEVKDVSFSFVHL